MAGSSHERKNVEAPASLTDELLAAWELEQRLRSTDDPARLCPECRGHTDVPARYACRRCLGDGTYQGSRMVDSARASARGEELVEWWWRGGVLHTRFTKSVQDFEKGKLGGTYSRVLEMNDETGKVAVPWDGSTPKIEDGALTANVTMRVKKFAPFIKLKL